MKIVVKKFGGTSVGDVDRIKRVAKRVKRTWSEGNSVVVVVSARAGVSLTDSAASSLHAGATAKETRLLHAAPACKSSPVKLEHLHRPVTAKKRQLCEGRNEGGAGPRCTVSVDTFPPGKQ